MGYMMNLIAKSKLPYRTPAIEKAKSTLQTVTAITLVSGAKPPIGPA
jgi:hypothetical protein